MPHDLALSSTLNGLKYPCLELIFMVPKVFEPLKFDCTVSVNCTPSLNVLLSGDSHLNNHAN